MSDVSQANLGLATSRDRTRRYRARLKRGHGKDIREKPLLERALSAATARISAKNRCLNARRF
jgi:hypothetical protein